MAEPKTVARPYAEAAFKIADAASRRAEWSVMLGALAQVSADARVRTEMGDPSRSAAQVAGLFLSILQGKLDGDAENFVRVLAENGRLALLDEVRSQFDELRNAREGVVEADVQSAFELDAAQLSALVAGLEKRTGRKVTVRTQIDKELIGGVRVVIGDKVFDGSARAQLAALETALKA